MLGVTRSPGRALGLSPLSFRWGRWHGEQEAQPEWQEEKLPEWDMPVNPDAEGADTERKEE